MEKETAVTKLPNEDVINKLASTFPAEKQGEMTRNVFLVQQTKTTGLGENKRKLTIYEAFTYTMACDTLGLNPILNHIIFLEDQIYITLQGHMQNAHSSGTLLGLNTGIIEKTAGSTNKNGVKTEGFRYFCEIKKRSGGEIAVFRAEGFADLDSIKNKYANPIFIEQMAEARAMRRCLARAFPVGMANIEDIQDDFAGESKANDDPNFILIQNIRECQDQFSLDALTDQIKKSQSKEVIAEYSKKSIELKQITVQEYIETKETKLDITGLENNQIAKKVGIINPIKQG